MIYSSEVAKGDVLVLVGTRKGAFILSSDDLRRDWSISGPHHTGADVFHMVYDHRDGGSVIAAVNATVWGPGIQISPDLGDTWRAAVEGPRFEPGDGAAVSRIWHVEPGSKSEPGVLYAGAEPASLFRSNDSGDTWEEVAGLTRHPSRETWPPGLGGLCLHSIVLDPSSRDRMWVGISAVGVFGTEDGGASWRTMNSGVRADFLPDRYPDL